jgi:hypothetical protein
MYRSIKACSSASSVSLTALGRILTFRLPPSSSLILSPITSQAFSKRSIAPCRSVVLDTMTYSGGATNLILIGISAVDRASPAASAAWIARIPEKAKFVTSRSARTLTGWGVSRRAMLTRSSSRISAGTFRGPKTDSGSL